jgi:hypothetical protein
MQKNASVAAGALRFVRMVCCDLVKQFGDAYREYQQKVSMLFPFKFIKAKLL